MNPETNPHDLPSINSRPIDGFELLETGTIEIYRSIYERIFWDLDNASIELAGPSINFANLIHAAAHLRLVLERITTASFVASHELFNKSQQNVETAKDFGEMRKRVRSLNPNYWPSAFGPVEHDGIQGIGIINDQGLPENEVGRNFGTVSRLLHASNPFRKKTDSPDDDLKTLQTLTEGLRDLLTSHIVQIADSSEFLYLRRHPDKTLHVQAVKTETPLL